MTSTYKMDTDKTLNQKDDFLMKDCLKLLESAEEIIQCPVCFENSDQMIQCVTGHLICSKCRGKICTNSCPFCKKIYSGTKSFFLPELSKTLSSLKISLYEFENNCVQKPINNFKAHRKLIKTILTKMAIFLNNTSGTFKIISNCLQNPNYVNQKQMEKEIMTLTTQLHGLECFMNDTKNTLISLKE